MSKLYERVLAKPNSSFFLFGMRGSGKSTWVSSLKNISLTINILNESLYQNILSNPLHFSGQLENLKDGSWVCIDEIQRIPSLLNEVHRFIEAKTSNSF